MDTVTTSVSASVSDIRILSKTRVYVLENTPPPQGRGEYQSVSFGGKNMERRREKGGKCKRKRKKGEENRRKGKENEKRGSKRVK
jgi:hypothetical protein